MPEIRNNPNTSPGARTLCEGPRSPDRCYPDQQQGSGHHHVTARKKWWEELNIVVIECYYGSNPIDENGVSLKGYRQRMYREWLERGPFDDATEKRICDQAKAIRKNGWLTDIELEMIKRKINTAGPQETDQEENQGVKESFPDSDELVARAELSIFINKASDE